MNMAGDPMENINKLSHDLLASEYMISLARYKNIHIEGCIRDGTLVLYHNLGSSKVPGKSDVINLIQNISEFKDQLKESGLLKLINCTEIEIEIYVFSGQMDFVVATEKNGEIEWITDLA